MSKFHDKQADQIQNVLDTRYGFYLVWVVTDDHYWLIQLDLSERYRLRPQVAKELFRRGVLKKVVNPDFSDNYWQSTLVDSEETPLELTR